MAYCCNRLPFEFGHLSGFWDFNNLSTVTESSNSISQINDQSPDNFTFTSSGTPQPVLTPNGWAATYTAAFLSANLSAMTAGVVNPATQFGLTVFIFGKHAVQNNQIYIAKHVSMNNGQFYIGRITTANTVRFMSIDQSGTRVDINGSCADNAFNIIAGRSGGLDTEMTLLVNNQIVATGTLANGLKNQLTDLRLGRYEGTDFPLNGQIGLVLTYKISLSIAMVRDIANYYIKPTRQFWGQ